jgi:hypothetical protein
VGHSLHLPLQAIGATSFKAWKLTTKKHAVYALVVTQARIESSSESMFALCSSPEDIKAHFYFYFSLFLLFMSEEG